MNSIKYLFLLVFISQKLFAQTPYMTFTVSHSNYDYLGSSVINNIVFKTQGSELAYMIRPFGQNDSRYIVNYSGPYSSGASLWFDSLDIFRQPAGFPNIDYGTTVTTSGMIGISSETISKIAIKTTSGTIIKDTPPHPVFVFSNGRIFLWSKSQSKLYRSDDLGNSFILIDSLKRFHPDIIYNPQGSIATISKSKNEKYILITGTSQGDGHFYDGIPQNRADNLWIMYSTDYGNTWNAERIAVDGYPNLVSNYHTSNFAPLFENFGQVDGAIDDSGYVYLAANGYGLVITGIPPYKPQFPMLVWTSRERVWKSISEIAIDTLSAISNYYPGSLIGQACPSIVPTLDLPNIFPPVVLSWTIPKLNLSNNNLIMSNGFYQTEVMYGYPIRTFNSLVWNIRRLRDFINVDNAIYATVGPDYVGIDPFDIPLVYMEDLINGSSVLGQNNPSMNHIKLTLLRFAFASNEDINTELNFSLKQNYPNPFNPGTTISWQSPVGSWQTIKLYDIMGREIETIVEGYYEAGTHSTLYIVNSALPSGVYFYQLRAGDYIETKKMTLLR